MDAKTIVFVCTGNTCRSPMAAGLARHILDGDGDRGTLVLSAGVHALPGVPATEEAVEALAEEGIDISRHRARRLTPELAEQASLILTMTGSHKSEVLRVAPRAESKTFTLTEYTGLSGDLTDPLGQPLAVYRDYASRLRVLVTLALKRFRGENTRTGQDNHDKM